MSDLDRVTVRPIEITDAEAMALLQIDVWEEAYDGLLSPEILTDRRARVPERIERWRRTIASSPADTTVADDRGKLVGFVSLGPARDDIDVAEEVWALYARRAWWGRGLGHRLLATVLADRPAYLWVLDGNERAIGFYERQGFTLDGAIREEPEGRHLRMVRRTDDLIR